MKATIEEPKSWQRVINVEISSEEVQKEFENKLTKYRKEVKLPGFRPGKVPHNLIKTRFGPAIRAEVIDDLVNKSFREACSENNIRPVNEAKISDIKVEDENPVTFKAEVEVDPEIEIKEYKKIKIKPLPNKVKDSDVDTTLNSLQERMAETKDIDRASKKGDLISIDYLSATVDGEPKDDLKSPQHPIEIGKGSLKDFDKGLIGLSAGEEADISVNFPKDYQGTDIAGKVADLKIKVKKVQEKIIPEVNEEFCKKVGGFTDKETLLEAIGMDLEAQEKERARVEAHNKAIDALIEKNDFEVPPSRIEFYLDKVIEDQARYFPPGKAPDRKEVSEKFRESGIRALKRYRIIEFVANKEKIKATKEEVDERIKAIADQYQKPFDEMKTILRKDGTTMRIREEMREQKTLDKLIGEIPWEEKQA